MNKGDKMLCDILSNGQPTGNQVPVIIGKIKRDHMTQNPQSVHVTTVGNHPRSVWVQPKYLHAQES